MMNKTYAFIDATNLFYGGKKSLGWKIDYRKLLQYLKVKYRVSKAFYERSSKEMRQLAGKDFRDFNYLRERLKLTQNTTRI